jgi:hypothetical protein
MSDGKFGGKAETWRCAQNLSSALAGFFLVSELVGLFVLHNMRIAIPAAFFIATLDASARFALAGSKQIDNVSTPERGRSFASLSFDERVPFDLTIYRRRELCRIDLEAPSPMSGRGGT